MTASKFAETCIILAFSLGFIDEIIRKAIPSHSIFVTAGKELLMGLAAIVIWGWLLPARQARLVLPWIPWIVFAAWAVFEAAREAGSALFFIVSLRVYLAVFFFYIVGMYIAHRPEAGRRILRVFLAGAVFSLIVQIGQEWARESLPLVIQTRLTIAYHSGAGGSYNESVFASPQTASVVAVVSFVWALYLSIKKRTLAYKVLPSLFLVSVILARIRTGLYLCAVGLVVMLLLGRLKQALTHRESIQLLQGLILYPMAILSFLYIAVLVVSYSGGRTVDGDDFDFYISAGSRDASERSTIPLMEITRQKTTPRAQVIGTGAGSGTTIRQFIKWHNKPEPDYLDTGLASMVYEFGFVGSFLFYAGLLTTLRNGLRNRLQRRSEGWLPGIITAILLSLWFTLKSKNILFTGMTAIVWLASLGFSAAATMAASESEVT